MVVAPIKIETIAICFAVKFSSGHITPTIEIEHMAVKW